MLHIAERVTLADRSKINFYTLLCQNRAEYCSLYHTKDELHTIGKEATLRNKQRKENFVEFITSSIYNTDLIKSNEVKLKHLIYRYIMPCISMLVFSLLH